jgi:hypothetical protein
VSYAAKMYLAFALSLAMILGTVYFAGHVGIHDARPAPYCHGQCKHDEKCQDMCIKNGCPHWND